MQTICYNIHVFACEEEGLKLQSFIFPGVSDLMNNWWASCFANFPQSGHEPGSKKCVQTCEHCTHKDHVRKGAYLCAGTEWLDTWTMANSQVPGHLYVQEQLYGHPQMPDRLFKLHYGLGSLPFAPLCFLC